MKKFLMILLILILIAVILYFFVLRKKEVAVVLPGYPGLPQYSQDTAIVEHTYFTLSYNEEYEQPDWVMYKLMSSYVTGESHERKNNFRADTAVVTGSATKKDYKKSGYDRGHLLPAADMGWSSEAMSETFLMSNMSPQVPGFNRGIWKKLETKVRKWAKINERLYVVVGPVLEDNLETIGENEVSIPRYYYKVIIDYQEPDIKAIGFVMENKKSDSDLFLYSVSIDSVEKLTGIDFFPALPDEYEAKLESTTDFSAWKN